MKKIVLNIFAVLFITSVSSLSFANEYDKCVNEAEKYRKLAFDKQLQAMRERKYDEAIRYSGFVDFFFNFFRGVWGRRGNGGDTESIYSPSCHILDVDPSGILFNKPNVYQGKSLPALFQFHVRELDNPMVKAEKIALYWCDYKIIDHGNYEKYTCYLKND